MEETKSLSWLADLIIVSGFVGITAACACSQLGKLILWIWDRIWKERDKHDLEE